MESNEYLKHFLIQKEEDNLRVDLFLTQKKIVLSRSQATKLLQDKKVFLKEKALKASYRLKQGESLAVFLTEKQAPATVLTPYNLALDILFEDEDLLVINKPAGLVVHPAPGHKDKTLVNALVALNKKLSSGSQPLRPGVVHRLDKDSSGLLLLAKNNETEKLLIEDFKKHLIQREYFALTLKAPRPLEGKIETWIHRHPTNRKKFHSSKNFQQGSKKAITFYKLIKEHDTGICWLQCKLKTGRTHQLRVHLSALLSPILGDSVYGNQKLSLIKDNLLKTEIKSLTRIALHAFCLAFKHPQTKKQLNFKSSWPKDLKPLLKKLQFE